MIERPIQIINKGPPHFTPVSMMPNTSSNESVPAIRRNIPSILHLYFLRVCANAEPASVFEVLEALGFCKTLLATRATLLEVCFVLLVAIKSTFVVVNGICVTMLAGYYTSPILLRIVTTIKKVFHFQSVTEKNFKLFTKISAPPVFHLF